MENKLPDDHLESFLRNSFKNYSEKPSEDVWDKIDFSLTNQTTVKPSRIKRIWPVAAAAAILMIIYLGATNIYLQQKLSSIEKNNAAAQVINNNINSISSGDTTNASITATNDQHPELKDQDVSRPMIEPAEQSIVSKNISGSKESKVLRSVDGITKNDPGVYEKPSSIDKEIVHQNQSNALSETVVPLNNRPAIHEKQKNKDKYDGKEVRNMSKSKKYKSKNSPQADPEYATKGDLELKNHNPSETGLAVDVANAGSIKDQSADLRKHNRSPDADRDHIMSGQNHSVIVLDQLPGMIDEVIYPEKNIAGSVFSEMVPAVIASGKRWSEISVYSGLLHQSGSVADLHRFGPALVNTFNTAHSFSSGVGYSLALNKHWNLSTGVAYKFYELINSVNQTLIFKDRINPVPGSMTSRHDWDYKLHCPGGTSDITIQSEQLDSRAVINDNEPIPVHITNHEELGYFSIPLTLNYRTSKGKISFFAGVGADLNVLTNVKFETPMIKINHPQLITRKDPRESRIDRSNKAVWNGIVTAGVAYSIAPRLNLQVSPMWYIPVNSQRTDRDVKLKSTSYGFQLGLNYSIASL